MKSTILLLLIPFLSFSQELRSVSSIAELRNLDVNDSNIFYRNRQVFVSGYYAPNDGGGGWFLFVDTSTKVDNGGTIIKPYGDANGRFERIFDRDVNILWFGAKRDGSADVSSIINTALKVANPIKNNSYVNVYGYGNVIIPGGTYKMDGPIVIKNSVNILGEGSGMFPYQEVRFIYAGNTKGIVILADKQNAGARSVTLKNLFLRNFGQSTDSSAHGLFTNTRIIAENVAIENFGGDGFRFQTNDSGNANNSMLINCTGFYNAKNGLFLSGAESNNIGIYSCNFSTNGMCGVLDNSFLGNSYYNCHTAFNGVPFPSSYSKSWCTYNGKVYQAIKYPNHSGIEPTVNPNWKQYWVENSTAFATNTPAQWDAVSTYWITGSYVVTSTSATSNFYGDYSEGGQGANMLNQFSVAYGGDHGAIFASKDNIYLRPSASQLLLGGSGMKVADKDSANTFAGFSNTFGLQLGSTKAGHSITQFKYYESDRTTKLFTANSTGNQAFKIINNGYDPSKLGLTSLSKTGMLVFPYFSGFYMGNAVNGNQERNISASTAPPPTTGRAYGDFCLYIGTDTSIIGYRFVPPGVWKTLKAAN